MIFRTIAFLSIFFLALFTPYFIWILAVFAYALTWQGVELLVISAYIDATFSTSEADVPYAYTLVFALLLFGTTLLKPYIRFYDREI